MLPRHYEILSSNIDVILKTVYEIRHYINTSKKHEPYTLTLMLFSQSGDMFCGGSCGTMLPGELKTIPIQPDIAISHGYFFLSSNEKIVVLEHRIGNNSTMVASNSQAGCRFGPIGSCTPVNQMTFILQYRE
jgi:hypothetical protein